MSERLQSLVHLRFLQVAVREKFPVHDNMLIRAQLLNEGFVNSAITAMLLNLDWSDVIKQP